MKQLILDSLPANGSLLPLKTEDFHYLCRVRRLKEGDSLYIKVPNSGIYKAELKGVSGTGASLHILNRVKRHGRAFNIELCLCLCKGKKLDLMIRQATEAGVHGITLLNSRFSQVKLSGKQEQKYERWKKIIREAQQQSGSPIDTKLHPVTSFKNLPSMDGNGMAGFFCHQEKLKSRGLKYLHQQKSINKIFIVIGSEGGLAPEEIQILTQKGFSSLFLGDNVLRAETASIFALASIISCLEII